MAGYLSTTPSDGSPAAERLRAGAAVRGQGRSHGTVVARHRGQSTGNPKLSKKLLHSSQAQARALGRAAGGAPERMATATMRVGVTLARSGAAHRLQRLPQPRSRLRDGSEMRSQEAQTDYRTSEFEEGVLHLR